MSTPVTITDRAFVRWPECTGMVEIESLRMGLAKSIKRSVAAAGLVYVMRGHTLVSVISEDMRHAGARMLTESKVDPAKQTDA